MKTIYKFFKISLISYNLLLQLWCTYREFVTVVDRNVRHRRQSFSPLRPENLHTRSQANISSSHPICIENQRHYLSFALSKVICLSFAWCAIQLATWKRTVYAILEYLDNTYINIKKIYSMSNIPIMKIHSKIYYLKTYYGFSICCNYSLCKLVTHINKY